MQLQREIKKVTRFFAKDAHGNKYRWAFWFDSGYGYWFLRDPEGYERCLETTWIDSAPLIRLTLTNYSMTADIS